VTTLMYLPGGGNPNAEDRRLRGGGEKKGGNTRQNSKNEGGPGRIVGWGGAAKKTAG